MRVLGKRHTWEILSLIFNGAKYITQIAQETKIPYTTVQHRVTELNNAGLVRIIDQIDDSTGKAIKVVRVSHFKISIEPKDILEMMEKENGPKITI